LAQAAEPNEARLDLTLARVFVKNRDNGKYKGVRVNGAKPGGSSFF